MREETKSLAEFAWLVAAKGGTPAVSVRRVSPSGCFVIFLEWRGRRRCSEPLTLDEASAVLAELENEIKGGASSDKRRSNADSEACRQ